MPEKTESTDSGRWYAREWREHVMELCEATAKQVQEMATHVEGVEKDVKNITRLVWTLVSGLAAVGLAFLGWVLQKL